MSQSVLENYSSSLVSQAFEALRLDHHRLHSDSDEPAPDDMLEQYLKHIGHKRKSVWAESYNPEADDDDSPTVIHPKTEGQRSALALAVKHILLFRSLDCEQAEAVIDAMFEKRVVKDDYVILQGDDGDNFYVIESGKYNTFVNINGVPTLVHQYDNVGSFGELALMYNMPRAATIQAATDGVLWAMDRITFRKIVLKSAYKRRQLYEALIDSVPILKSLENYERMNVADALVPRNFQDGASIIKEGDSADGMYFIEDGNVSIVKVIDGVEREVNRGTKGGYFGELALLNKKPRAASVIAVGTVKCAFLDTQAFERLLGPCLEIMQRNAEQFLNMVGSNPALIDNAKR